jgi:hypothetical protein
MIEPKLSGDNHLVRQAPDTVVRGFFVYRVRRGHGDCFYSKVGWHMLVRKVASSLCGDRSREFSRSLSPPPNNGAIAKTALIGEGVPNSVVPAPMRCPEHWQPEC